MTLLEPESKLSTNGLGHLVPLMQAKGVTIAPNDFHREVNVIFHSFESDVYDRIHKDMKESLPRQFQALTSDYLARYQLPESLTVLDIGCGTGLSTEILLSTAIGARVRHVDLLDTSAAMLEKCSKRSCLQSVSHRLIQGTLDAMPAEPTYDVILTCSVLHHIPDLKPFLSAVSQLQHAGGAFFHLQDPNGDWLNDSELKSRIERLSNHFSNRLPAWTKRLTPRRIGRRLWREISGKEQETYIDRINGELMRRGLISHRMTENELWSLVDVHVYDGQGVSIQALQTELSEYELVSARSYSFFGTMYSDLPRRFRMEEDRLHNLRAQNGMHVAAIWRRRG